MKKYSVLVTVDASIRVVVDAENEDQAKDIAMEKASRPSVCHHCARQLDIGDIIDAVEAVEMDD